MHRRFPWVPAFFAVAAVWLAGGAQGADWPMWRYDAGRTGVTPEKLPDDLHLQWVRKYPPLKPAFWQVRQGRLQFDLGYEPVVMGKTMFVGSSRNDSVTAIDTETGAEKWRFYADGPVRFAPAAWKSRAYFSSDDGHLYCLDAAKGTLLWRHKGSPSGRKVLGNGRLVSLWPARGGPVIADGRVYFTAGIWPFEGVFVYAFDADTGKVIWVNDSSGSRYVEHPHAAMAFGGPSPQGYLLVNGGQLVVPSSKAFPAYFDLETGKLDTFEFGFQTYGSFPGSWFVCTDRNGRICVDPGINTEIHDTGHQVIGQMGGVRQKGERPRAEVSLGGKSYRVAEGIRETISVGGRTYRSGKGFKGVSAEVHTMLAADGKLFVVTREGDIYCFGGSQTRPKRHETSKRPLIPPHRGSATEVDKILSLTGMKGSGGYALVWGLGTGRLVDDLVLQTKLHVVAVDPDARKVDALRKRLDGAGLYGTRVAAHVGDPLSFGFPPYVADLIVSGDLDAAGFVSRKAFVEGVFRSLRPYGGVACLAMSSDKHASFAGTVKDANLREARVERVGGCSLLTRVGRLPGSANCTGPGNYDELARAPFGVLWFGDTFYHHKKKPWGSVPKVVNGVMEYRTFESPFPVDPEVAAVPDPESKKWKKVHIDVFTDVFTGRVLSKAEAAKRRSARGGPPAAGATHRQEVLYSRINPLTGVEEARTFLKSHGCATPKDYGYVVTMRSGTTAYYDKRLESGTVNLSGVRPSCLTSTIPADGLLSLPSWSGNCACNYQVSTSLTLRSMPEEFEQWSAWGGVAVEAPVERGGINFGAPGDRIVEDGTLWLDYPSVGGPSPEVPVSVAPEKPEFYYRHSLWMKGGRAWPWVVASGVKGVRSVTIEPIAKRSGVPANSEKHYRNTFGIRWVGMVEPEFSETYTFYAETGYRVRLWIDGRPLIDNAKSVRRGKRGEVSAELALKAGEKRNIRMEYYHREGERAMAQLRWSSPSTPKSIIPKKSLFTADGRPGGLTGSYYGIGDFTGPAALRIDPQIRFDWGREFPDAVRTAGKLVKPYRKYTVRLYFAEPDKLDLGQRVFSVALQGREVLKEFDIVKEAGGPMRGVVKEFKGVEVEEELKLEFSPKSGEPLICGVEMIAERR